MAIFIKEKIIERISSHLKRHQRKSVLDHLRESVRNLNMQRNARAYTAIVDQEGWGDFKDIQLAIDYVHELGGGSVLLLPGTYTLTDNLVLYSDITLEGRTPQDTIISFATAAKSVLIKGSDMYNDGTVTINSGETTVVGVGTNWSTNLTVGHHILLGGSNWFQIVAIADDTHITIANKYFGKALSGDSYKAAIVKNNVELRRFSVVLSGGIGIDVQYVNNLKMFNMFSLYHVGDALKLDVTNWNILDYVITGHCGGRGVYINEMYNSSCDKFFIFNNVGTGLEFGGDSENNSFDFVKTYNNNIGMEIKSSSNNSFHRVDAKYNTNEGILINGADNTSFDTIAGNNGTDGIKLEGNSDFIIIGDSSIENNSGYGVNISAVTCNDALINGCQFSGNSSGAANDQGTDTIISGNVGLADSGTGAITAAGDVIQASADTERSTVNQSYTKKKEIICGDKGELRIKFDLKSSVGSDGFNPPTANGEDYDDWVEPEKAYADDELYAVTVYPGPAEQDYYSFGLDIPSGAVIKGIEVKIYVANLASANQSFYAALSWDGGPNYTATKEFANVPISKTEHIFGGAADNWGRSWTIDELSNANFRVKLWDDVGNDNFRHKIWFVSVKVYFVPTANGRIYKNGVAVGAVQSDNTEVYTNKSEDVSDWKQGDLVQLYIKSGGNGSSAYARNFRIYSDRWNISTN